MEKTEGIPQQENHGKMTLVEELTERAGVFECPICNRKLIVQFNPYKKIVLVAGDEYAMHAGSMGIQDGASLEIMPPDITTPSPKIEYKPGELAFIDEQTGWRKTVVDRARLKNWEEWLKRMGFDSFWTETNDDAQDQPDSAEDES